MLVLAIQTDLRISELVGLASGDIVVSKGTHVHFALAKAAKANIRLIIPSKRRRAQL